MFNFLLLWLGQLGIGTTVNAAVPTHVPGLTNVIQICTEDVTSFALLGICHMTWLCFKFYFNLKPICLFMVGD